MSDAAGPDDLSDHDSPAPSGHGSLAPSGEQEVQRGCGTVSADYPDFEGGSGVRLVRVKGISCPAARQVARRCIRQEHVKGWHARFDCGNVALRYLRSGRHLIVMKGIAGGGPGCMPPI